MRPLRCLSALVFVALLLFLPSAAAGRNNPRVILMIVEHVRPGDIGPNKTPNLYKMANADAVGLISVRKPFAYKNISSAFYTTLGAGSAAVGLEPGRKNAPRTPGERAARIAKLNKKKNIRASFGALGQSLHDAGLRTAAVGNASGAGPNIDFLDAVMDARGRVDFLAVRDSDNLTPGSPRLTNSAKFLANIRRASAASSLVVADFGDLHRLKSIEPPPRRKRLTAEAVTRADALIGDLSRNLAPNDLLMVIMPFSKAGLNYGLSGDLIAKGEPLSPVVIRGGGLKGLLRSPTTRHNGVVSTADLMPTILDHLNIATRIQYTARPVYAVPYDGDKLAYIRDVSAKAIRHDAFMLPVLIGYALFGLLTLVGTLIAIWTGLIRHSGRTWRVALTAVFLFPFAVNLEAFFNFQTLGWALIFILAVLLTSIPLTLLSKNALLPLVVAAAATPFLLLVDTFTGQTIAGNSLLGNSVLAGGRYYGLGNQFLGFLFIYTVLFIVIFGSLRPDLSKRLIYKVCAGLLFVVLVVGVGATRFGANFGGLVTLAAALPLVYFKLFSEKTLTKRHVALFAVAALLTVFFFALNDVMQSSRDQSHVASLLGKDVPFAVSMIKSKLLHNLEETYMVLFTWGGLLGLGAIFGLLWAIRDRASAVFSKFPLFRLALPGIFLAGLTAYLANDTGIEPLSIIGLYTLAAFLYLSLCLDAA